jgi:crotonobetainyl-CoA hydratase
MYAAFSELNDNPDLRVCILSSAGNSKNIFSAGWDLKAFAAGEGTDEENGFDHGPGGLGGLPESLDRGRP